MKQSEMNAMNGKAGDQEEPKVLTDIITDENAKMEAATNSQQDKPLVQNEGKSSYSKPRSSVVDLWKKREGTIKAANAVPKEKTRDIAIDFEEKKESNHRIDVDSEQDARRQKNSSATEVLVPEPTIDESLDRDMENSKNTSVNVAAFRRSSIKNSWKKKAANIPTSQPAGLTVVTTNMDRPTTNSDMSSPQSRITPESKEIPSATEKSNAPTNTRVVERSNTPTNTRAVERSNTPTNTRAVENSPSSAFNELKSKWAKFGVQKENEGEKQQSQLSPRTNTSVESPLKVIDSASEAHVRGDIAPQSENVAKESPKRNYNKSKSFLSQRSSSFNNSSVEKTSPENTKPRTKGIESPLTPNSRLGQRSSSFNNGNAEKTNPESTTKPESKEVISPLTPRSRLDQRSSSFNFNNVEKTNPEESTKPESKETESPVSPRAAKNQTNTKSASSETVSTGLSSRKLGAKSFRSKYRRGTVNRGTEKITSPTNNTSADAASEQNTGNPSEPKKPSPDYSVPPIEKESIAFFPPYRSTPNDCNLPSSSNVSSALGRPKIDRRSRSCGPKVSHTGTDSSLQTTALLDDAPTTKEGSAVVSPSPLSSRASRRIRDVRQKQQTQRKDENENTKKETNVKRSVSAGKVRHSSSNVFIQPESAQNQPLQEPQIQEPGRIRSRTSPFMQRIRTHEPHGNNFIPMDESAAFSSSLCSGSTYGNSQTHSAQTGEFTSENATVGAESRSTQRSSLHTVVPDMNEMVPDEFVSENDSNFESFKTAVDRTSFIELAKDLQEDARCVFNVTGIQTALNSFGGLFNKPSPKKVVKRPASPVEEVAIEVEYVADSD